MGLALLAHASMPLNFWDEAFLAATYIINCIPSKVINFDTPLERLFQQQPNYTCFRVFGCACWPNLRPYNTHKLQFLSKQCVFLGYSTLHKGFKCLDPNSGRVYISRDVTFDENVFPFAHMHSYADARLRSEFSLLRPTLISHVYDQGEAYQHDHIFNSPDAANDSHGESAGENNSGTIHRVAEGGQILSSPVQHRASMLATLVRRLVRFPLSRKLSRN